MPSPRERPDPWWYSPTRFQVIATPEAIRKCELSPLLIVKITNALADSRFPTRPRRAKRKWVESVCVEGAMYQLTCCVDTTEKMIVITYIRPPKRMRRTKIYVTRV